MMSKSTMLSGLQGDIDIGLPAAAPLNALFLLFFAFCSSEVVSIIGIIMYPTLMLPSEMTKIDARSLNMQHPRLLMKVDRYEENPDDVGSDDDEEEEEEEEDVEEDEED